MSIKIIIKNEWHNQMILNIMFLWCGRELYCYAQIIGECNHGRVFHQFCSLLPEIPSAFNNFLVSCIQNL